MICLNHHDRSAVSRCAACGKPLCEICLSEMGNTGYCSEKCQTMGEAAKERSSEVISVARKTDRKSGIKAFLWVMVLLLIVAGVIFFYTRNREKVNEVVADGKDKIVEVKDEAISAGKNAMPQDTKYKQERENLVK